VVAGQGWYHTKLGDGVPWLPVAVAGFLAALFALFRVPFVRRALTADGMASQLELPHKPGDRKARQEAAAEATVPGRIRRPPPPGDPLKNYLWWPRPRKQCYCETVKNITVSVPDHVYRNARVAAAQRDTSLSALVVAYLERLSGRMDEFARLEALQREVQAEIGQFRAADRVSRDEVHDRAVR
jgi:hypothetical protein